MENLVNDLKAMCALAGTNLTEVCRDAGVSRGKIERWKKDTPRAVSDYLKILEAIENRKRQTA